MARLRIKFDKSRATGWFRDGKKFLRKLEDLTPLMKQMVPLMRKSVRKEFRSKSWDGVHGGGRWEKQKKFGTREKRPLLNRSGNLLQSWLSGFRRITKTSAEITGQAVNQGWPYGVSVRGGGGLSVPSRFNIIVKAETIGAKGLPTMFWLFGMRYGVWIKPEKLLNEGLRIPTRPHGVVSKQLEEDVRKTANKYLARAFSG